jgi:hypothetical protein
METLGTIIGRAIRTAKSAGEWSGGVMNRILGVCQTAPVGAVDKKDSHWECWPRTSESLRAQSILDDLLLPRMNSAMPATFMAIAPKK